MMGLQSRDMMGKACMPSLTVCVMLHKIGPTLDIQRSQLDF